MSRIGATISGIERRLLNSVASASAAATLNELHLATGQRVNSPADDPAAFIALSQFRSQLGVVTSALGNATQAASMLNQTETTISQIRTQLTTIQEQLLTDEEGSLTPSERAAAQATIDSAISQINVLANTSINGKRVLNGSADYTVTGRDSSQVSRVQVHTIASGSASVSSQSISGSVVETGAKAQLTYTGASGKTTAAATFTLTGDLGSVDITVTNGQSLAGTGGVAAEINKNSHKTGVVATVNGDTLTLSSVNYGSAADVGVSVTSGTFTVTGGHGDGTANGSDATALINGQQYTGGGNTFSVNQNGFRFDIEFAAGFEGTFDTMTVSGNALTFALSTNVNNLSRLSIPSVLSSQLGGESGVISEIASGGAYSGLGDNTSQALRIVDEALAKLDTVQLSVAGFNATAVTSASDLLSDMEINLTDAIAVTDGYDEAEETLLLSKNEQLMANGLAALTILQDQRKAMADMLQHIAGLD